jgi:hypothetical protein
VRPFRRFSATLRFVIWGPVSGSADQQKKHAGHAAENSEQTHGRQNRDHGFTPTKIAAARPSTLRQSTNISAADQAKTIEPPIVQSGERQEGTVRSPYWVRISARAKQNAAPKARIAAPLTVC